MTKYVSHAVTFQEVPDEICLTIQIADCPHKCKGCHSAYLQENIGENLEEYLPYLLKKYDGRITCVCFMGTGRDFESLGRCIEKAKHVGLKTALYSGYSDDEWLQMALQNPKGKVLLTLFRNLDYLKTGRYIAFLGGLDSPDTNQRMYRMTPDSCEDITYRFRRTH